MVQKTGVHQLRLVVGSHYLQGFNRVDTVSHEIWQISINIPCITMFYDHPRWWLFGISEHQQYERFNTPLFLNHFNWSKSIVGLPFVCLNHVSFALDFSWNWFFVDLISTSTGDEFVLKWWTGEQSAIQSKQWAFFLSQQLDELCYPMIWKILGFFRLLI